MDLFSGQSLFMGLDGLVPSVEPTGWETGWKLPFVRCLVLEIL